MKHDVQLAAEDVHHTLVNSKPGDLSRTELSWLTLEEASLERVRELQAKS